MVDPEGSGGQTLAMPAVFRGTAEAGRFETVREGGSHSTSEASVRPSVPTPDEPAFRSPEGSHEARAGGFANRCRRLGSAPGNRLRIMQLSDSGSGSSVRNEIGRAHV